MELRKGIIPSCLRTIQGKECIWLQEEFNSLEYSLTPQRSSVGWGVGESARKLRTRSFESTDWGASGVDPAWGWSPKRSLQSTAASLCSRSKTLGSDIPLNQQQKTTPKGKKQKPELASLLYCLKSAGLWAYWMELLSQEDSSTRFSEPPVCLWKPPRGHAQMCASQLSWRIFIGSGRRSKLTITALPHLFFNHCII